MEESRHQTDVNSADERRSESLVTSIPHGVETHFQGLPISDGLAIGRVCLFNERRHHRVATYRVGKDGISTEQKRLTDAIADAADQIDLLIDQVAQKVGQAEAEIFTAQKMILQDPALFDEMTGIISIERVNAEAAVTRTLDACEARIREVDNEYLRERATDIGEVRRRILDVLQKTNPSLACSGGTNCQRGKDRLIVAVELTPSLTIELDAEHTFGFVTKRGGATSHAAILARGLGIPAVSGIKNIHGLISCGTEVLINGETGEVVIWPSKKTIAEHTSISVSVSQKVTPVEPVSAIKVRANISLADEASEAMAMRAEGIGLYRTEFEFIAAGRLLDEDEQFHRYASVVKTMNTLPVAMRLLDIGGDKNAPFLDLPREPNPYLGFRGSRLLLARPELLRAQARAIVRASALGPIEVLYPMIIDKAQFLALKDLFISSTSDLPAGDIKHGVMFEVPSACLEAREILEVSDFASIGSNDLVQYLFAVDRDNELVAHDYNPDRPIFWRLIEKLSAAAMEAGKEISVCGEAVRNPSLLAKFMGNGIRIVSVSARLIPQLRLAAEEQSATL